MLTDTGVVDRDLAHSTRFGIAPSIALGLGTDTSVHPQLTSTSRPRRGQDYGVVVASPPEFDLSPSRSTEFGVPRSNYMGFAADHDKNTADLVTAKLSTCRRGLADIRERYRARRSIRATSAIPRPTRCDNTIGDQLLQPAFCLASPVPVRRRAPSIPPRRSARTGGGGPYHQNSWGVQDIASANADFHIGEFRNQLIAGIDVSYQRADRTIYAYTLPPRGNSTLLSARRSHRGARQYRLVAVTIPPHQPIPAMTWSCRPPATVRRQATTGRRHHGGDLDRRSHRSRRLRHRPLLVHRTDFRDRGPARRPVSRGLQDPVDRRRRPIRDFKSPSFLFDPRASLVFEPDQTQTYYVSWGKAATPIGTSVVGSPTPISSAAASALQARQEREHRSRRQDQPVRWRAGPVRRAASARPSPTRCRPIP